MCGGGGGGEVVGTVGGACRDMCGNTHQRR